MVRVKAKVPEFRIQDVTVPIGDERHRIQPVRPRREKRNSAERGRRPGFWCPEKLAFTYHERVGVVAKIGIYGDGIAMVFDSDHKFLVCHHEVRWLAQRSSTFL